MVNKVVIRRFEFKEGRSNKYWEVSIDDDIVITHWGKMGTAGAYQPKSFISNSAAADHMNKKIKEKLTKGYREVSTSTKTLPTLNMAPPNVPTQDQTNTQIDQVSSDEKQKRAFRM